MWVFGYGSLLWNPGFVPAETVKARLEGFHRSFCMTSIHHRGTMQDPGLVLALEQAAGRVCHGLALRAGTNAAPQVLAELRERELVSSAYVEHVVNLDLEDGRCIQALAYVIEPSHPQYCRHSLERQAEIIAAATGGRGPNTEYLHRTVARLAELGVEDSELAWLDRRVRELQRG